LPTSTLWRPNGRGLHSTSFKRSNDQLEYHCVFIFEYSSVCEESPQVGASRPYNIDHKESTRVRLGEQHTQDLNLQHNHTHKPRLELKTQHREFATQTELKSLTQRIKCVDTKSRSLRMFLESLVVLLHAPRGPFYSPKAARSRWSSIWKAILAFCRVVHHRTATIHVRCAISFHIGCSRPLLLGAGWRTERYPVHTADRWSGPRVTR
jgi:hypothetical protein